jgi:hypothetical protein
MEPEGSLRYKMEIVFSSKYRWTVGKYWDKQLSPTFTCAASVEEEIGTDGTILGDKNIL